MEIAIGLPNAVSGTTGEQLTEWARRAESRGFSSLGTIDRVTYGNYEPLVALSAAAAVTERIGLVTAVLLAPLRVNGAILGKQTLSLNALSGGRLTLGVGLGGRDDDYAAIGADMGSRGADVEEILGRLTEVWADAAIGPDVAPPRLVIGGAVQATFDRAAKHGSAGWIGGGGPPDQFADSMAKVNQSWAKAGRDGEPVGIALAYFSLGDDPEGDANRYLGDYYSFLGEETAGYIAGSAAKDSETVRGYIGAFAEAGCDELILFPCSNDPAQVDLLADAAASEREPMADELEIRLFAGPAEFEEWLEANGHSSPGLWLKLAKKGAPKPSVTYAEALDLALCFGWIDSQKRGHDEAHFLQRFSPRRPRGRWSKINREKAEALGSSGALRPAGTAEIAAAKEDGRWEAAYEGQRTAKVPEDLQAALEANPAAAAFFAELDGANRYAITYRLAEAKKPETRERRLGKFLAMLERGEKIHE